jgi:ethanolaminephosphotransferase
MNEAGNHGGSDPGDTEAALLFASPKFRMMPSKKEYECPTLANEGTLYNFYDQAEQQDLVPTLSGLLGLPIPRNNIGRVLGELRGAWRDEEAYVNLKQNAQQLWSLVDAVLGRGVLRPKKEDRYEIPRMENAKQLPCNDSTDTVDKLACLLKIAEQQAEQSRQTQQYEEAITAYEEFLTLAQRALIDGNRPFSIFHMAVGIATCALALLTCLYSIDVSRPSVTTATTFALIVMCFGTTLYSSTFARSEQSFWYLFSAAWIIRLTARAMSRCQSELVRSRITRACIKTLAFHCIAVCWTHLGPLIDIEVFSRYITLQWFTVPATYSWSSINIVQHTFGGLTSKRTTVSLTMPLATAAFVFKVSRGQEHPDGIALPFVVDMTCLFRTVLVLTALAALLVCVLVARKNSPTGTARHSTLSKRLHHLLTLFLITQSKVQNTPLFLVLEHQRTALQTLLQHDTPAHPDPNPVPRRDIRSYDASAVDVAISVLLFSHTYFFCFGGSDSISSIDLSNAYNGVSQYSVVSVGVLLFSVNWTGAIWWCSAACDLVPRGGLVVGPSVGQQSAHDAQRRPHGNDGYDKPTKGNPSMPWLTYLSTLSAFMAAGVLIVMILCVVKRQDRTVWILWGPKYLYSVFWVLEWHLIVSVGLSSLLRAAGSLG